MNRKQQRTIFADEARPYPPERLIQPANVAELLLSLLRLPRTGEVAGESQNSYAVL